MEIRISRETPGCIVFLLDRSGSMGRQIEGSSDTLADSAATVVNKALRDILRRSSKGPLNPRHIFDVAVISYGFTPGIGPNSVASALGGDLAEAEFYSPEELRQNILPDLIPGQEPVWIAPVYGGRTPMCRALDTVGGLLSDWAHSHAEASPPVVINVSDGLVTDSPYEGSDLQKWHDRISGISTSRGVVKVFDLVLAPGTSRRVLRPATTGSLKDPGWTVVQAATFLPDIEMSPWTSSLWLKAEEDPTTPDFLRRAELADDIISEIRADRRVS